MRPAFFLVLMVLSAALFAPAAAQPARAPGVRPLDSILAEIRRSHPGQFYDADGPTPGPDGTLHYHLKWMTPDGRIEWLDTDARTGRVLGASPGRDNFDGPGPGRYYPPAPSYPVPQFFGEQSGPRAYGGGPRRGFGNRRDYGHDGRGSGGRGRRGR